MSEKDLVRAIGDRIGYGRLMQLAEEVWREKASAEGLHGSEHTTGPCAAFMVRCQCLEEEKPELDRNGHCDWCCGAGRVTERVRAEQKRSEAIRAKLRDVFADGGEEMPEGMSIVEAIAALPIDWSGP